MPKAETSEVPGVTIRGAGAEQRLFGRYTLKRVLGRGGMGIVWLAHDDELKRSVAMKFLPDMIVRDREAVEDLKRETRRSLDLTHHHIVRIYDFTQDDNSAAIIMEYVDGETLSAMKTQQPGSCFGVSTLSIWAGHFCQALDYAHRQARVVHRDLKPANLMVNSRGDLKITDFGISRSMSDSMTRVSMSNTAGTLAYMSPEQALGAPPAASDDIYAFGATIYDLLTGRPPFFRGNLQVQLETVVPPPMQARRAELGNAGEPIPALWEEVIAACLAKKPAERPQSMAEIANLLGIGGPTTGYRPGTHPTFSPLSGVITPGTTRATQAAQPPTAPTLQRTLSPDELVTRVQSGPVPPGPVVPKTSPPPPQPVKPTSIRDVIPGFDFASEPKAKAAPPLPPVTVVPEAVVETKAPEVEAAAVEAPELEAPAVESPESPEVEAHEAAAPEPVAEVEPLPPAEPTLLEVIDDGFPTMVGQPIEPPDFEEAVVETPESPSSLEEPPPVEQEYLGADEQPTFAEDPSSGGEQAEEMFPTLRGDTIEPIVETSELEVQQPLQEQEASDAEVGETDEAVTLLSEEISAPDQGEEIEFPTFAGTPLQEVENPPSAEEPVVPLSAEMETPVRPEPVAFEPHVFRPPSQEPALARPPRKPLVPALVVATIAALVIGAAVWMGMYSNGGPRISPKEKLALPYIEQGRAYFSGGALDDADNQARLALERNPGDPRAIQLQQEIQGKRNAVAAEKAAADKAAQEIADEKAAAQKALAEKEASEREAQRKAMELAEAQKLVRDGEQLVPKDLASARRKADEALTKVPQYPPAVALLTKIDEQQKERESTFTAALDEASIAFDRDKLDDADRALSNIPPDLAGRDEVRKLREKITQRRVVIERRPEPTPRPSIRAKVDKPTKPIPKVTKKPDDGPTRVIVRPPVDRPPPTPAPKVIVVPGGKGPKIDKPFKGPGSPGG